MAQEKAIFPTIASLCYFPLLRFFVVRGAVAPPRHRPGLPRRRLLCPAVALSNFRSRPLPHYTYQRISDLGWGSGK